MKITKVKIKQENQSKENAVSIQRNEKQGFLLLGTNNLKINEEEIRELIEQKKEEFQNSVFNKTIIKKLVYKAEETKGQKSQKKKHYYAVKDIFNFIIKGEKSKEALNLDGLEKLPLEKLSDFFNHKFASTTDKIRYNDQNDEFNLIEEFTVALKNKKLEDIANAMPLYKSWKDYYIRNKQEYLAKSIFHNNLPAGNVNSPRKGVLDNWTNKLIHEQKIDLAALEQQFELNVLCTKWEDYHNKAEKLSDEIEKLKNKKDLKEGQDVDKSICTLKDIFSFKCELKKILQTHQNEKITLLKNNSELNQYSLEVSKYLMHYFPLKTSGRKLTNADIKYYLEQSTVHSSVQKQINNAVVQHILQKGKMAHYKNKNTGEENIEFDSNLLQQIHVQETFALKFINACAFATNNLRNCIDPVQVNDILGKKELRSAVGKLFISKDKQQNVQNLSHFFAHLKQKEDNRTYSTSASISEQLLSDDTQLLNFIMAVRGAIQQIRNNVIHFKKYIINDILTISRFENLKIINNEIDKNSFNETYSSNATILPQLLQDEIAALPELFAEKLKSMSLFEYYLLDDIKENLSTFHLDSKPLSFVPGFKKIFQWGKTYQYDNQSGLDLKIYFKKEAQTSAEGKVVHNIQDEAHYNALFLLYEQQFISYFFNDTAAFFTAADEVIVANKKRPKKNEKQYGFAQVEKLLNNYLANEKPFPLDFLKEVQSNIIVEENEKREKEKKRKILTKLEQAIFSNSYGLLLSKGLIHSQNKNSLTLSIRLNYKQIIQT